LEKEEERSVVNNGKNVIDGLKKEEEKGKSYTSGEKKEWVKKIRESDGYCGT